MGPVRAQLDATRLHFQHGPIDLVIEATGERDAVAAAYRRAWERFQDVLQRLVGELPALRSHVDRAQGVKGPVARRMLAACLPYREVFITPMAAVAGAVADEIMTALADGEGIRRAYVNNGGDIALHLEPGERFAVGLVADPSRALRHGHAPALDGSFEILAAQPIRGIATSGWRGRSFSLGIADSVTVLARDAAAADAAATMIANAVDVDDPAVVRRAADELADDTDLGRLPVTVAVGRLPDEAVECALDAGARRARALLTEGLIACAALSLQSRARVVGGPSAGLRAAA